MKTWNIEEVTGYSPMYTFFEDFSIADIFGEEAIFDTFKRCMIDWKNDYKAMTEFSMALNWKCWEHYNNQDPKWKLYKLLYEKFSFYHLFNYIKIFIWCQKFLIIS